MAIKLDFSNTGDSTFEPLPAGLYPATVFDIKQKVGKDSGQPYLEFTFALSDQNGRRAWSNYSLQPAALWKLKSTLLALGVPAKSLEGNFELDPKDLLGRECVLELIVDSWQGKATNSVNEVHPKAGTKAAAKKGF